MKTRRPHPDALDLAIEALEAQREVDQLTATFYTLTRHGNALDEDERAIFEGLKRKKLAAVQLRDKALQRAYPPVLSAAKAVKGS